MTSSCSAPLCCVAESCAQEAVTTQDALGFSNPLVLDHRSSREEVLISKRKKNKNKQPKDGLGLFICVSDSHLGSLLTNCSFSLFPIRYRPYAVIKVITLEERANRDKPSAALNQVLGNSV